MGLDPLIAQLLASRGLDSPEKAEAFLNPCFRDLHDPDTLPNATAAARRLLDAARQKRPIVIYGDYDVDGVTGVAILWHALRMLDADVEAYIPSRFDEGYGVNSEALQALAGRGARLVVTVDCGITAVGPAARARALGIELIITDHHQPRDTLPDALIVHPTALGMSSNPNLSGAGVAMKVAWALARLACGRSRVDDRFRAYLMDATALAALGLVADLVPLTGENRVLATFGLRQLPHVRNPGLRALIEVSGLAGQKRYDEYHVGFMLAPRLNAIGRMGHAIDAVELLTTAEGSRARELAAKLDRLNRQRQDLEKRIYTQAAEMVIQRQMHRAGCHGIVLASDQWHVGIVGIVASRIVERFGRPAVLIALDDDGSGQGSGRSVPHFPLHQVLAECSDVLESYGGHAMAAGVRIRREQVPAFTQRFQQQAARRLRPADLAPRLRLDAEIELARLSTELVDTIQRMAPFSIDNPRPRLTTPPVELVEPPRTVGRNAAHLALTLRQGDAVRRAIAFGRGAWACWLTEQRKLRIAFEPMINEWNGRRRVELRILDIQPLEPT